MSRIRNKLRSLLTHVLSPVFLSLLAVSFMLWFIIKLGHVYTTEMPINVSIDGERLRVTCVVQGRGSTLWGQRFRLFGRINLKLDELSVKPSADDPDMLVIGTKSLEKAISMKNNDLQIISITDIPLLPKAKKTDD